MNERYIALLRGINISGKNKVSMSELKEGFIQLDFTEVVTYLNSGNVIFTSNIDNENILMNKIQSMIKDKFKLDIPIYVILQKDLEEVLKNAPDWWGNDNKEKYDNIIFLIPPLSYVELYEEIGDPKAEYEKVYHYKNFVFWSFLRSEYQRTNWWTKTANVKVSNRITIRTANTVRKIVYM